MRDTIKFETLYLIAYADAKYYSNNPIQDPNSFGRELITRVMLAQAVTKLHKELKEHPKSSTIQKFIGLKPLEERGAIYRLTHLKRNRTNGNSDPLIKMTRIGTRSYKGMFNKIPILEITKSGARFLINNWDAGMNLYLNSLPEPEFVKEYLLKVIK